MPVYTDKKLQLNSPDVTKVLKDVYLPAMEAETWNNAGALTEGFSLANVGTVANPTGKLDVYIKKGKHGSVGAFGDDYTFDSAVQKITGDEMVIRSRGFQANARIDVVPNRRMNTAAAIENVFADQFTELTDSLKKNYTRMLYGDGSGVITTTTNSAAVVPTAGSYAEVPVADVRSFEIGDIISIGAGTPPTGKHGAGVKRVNDTDFDATGGDAATDGVLESSLNRGAAFGYDQDGASLESLRDTTFMVVDVDDIYGKLTLGLEDGKVFDAATITKITNIPATAKIYYRRSINQDIHGLKYIIGYDKANDGYFGLGETIYGTGTGAGRPKYMKSYINDQTTKNVLTEYEFMRAIDLQERRGADMTKNAVITSRATRASIASTNQGATTGLLRLVRNASATAANDQRSMGYQGVDLRGETIEADRFAPRGDVWFLDFSGFKFAEEQGMTFDDFDGSIWKQVILTTNSATGKGARALAYEANMYAYKEMFNDKPRTLAVIKLGDKPKHIEADVTSAVEDNSTTNGQYL